ETEEQRRQKTEVNVNKDYKRLEHPQAGSFFGAMFSSSVGIFIMLVIYGAGIYAAYEVALFRRRPVGLVCGLAAIPGLGFLSPIISLPIPTQEEQGYQEEVYQPEGTAPAPGAAPQAPSFTVPGVPPPEPEPTTDTGGLKLAHAAPAAGG